jgi:hypothetical protein
MAGNRNKLLTINSFISMKQRRFTDDDLALLQNEKGNICISVISSTHRFSPERRTDQVRLEKVIQRAKDYLQNKYSGKDINTYIQAIDELFRNIDFNNNAEGIGLFVSENIKKRVQFFFPVKEKVIIGNLFEIRDLLYEDYYKRPYMVLLLSEKEAKLFKGRLHTVTEITDDHFPYINKAEYEYNRPTRGSSYVGNAFEKEFEKDKSILEEIRFQNYYRQTDSLLNSYLVNQTPMIVVSAGKNLAHFRKITQHDKNIVCYIPGNYFLLANNELGDLSWNDMKLFLENSKEDLINYFKEKIGEGLGITGIQNIWKAAKEGRGFKLLVENDFTLPGFIINEEEYHLYLQPPNKNHQVLADAINNLIEIVLEKKGEVIMLENDRLKDYERIALITRY